MTWLVILAAWIFPAAQSLASTPPKTRVFARYFSDSFESLDCLRSDIGLVMDKARVEARLPGSCPITPIEESTSPSNIALDLLVQIEATGKPELALRANRNIQKIISTLARLSFHPRSGLFFNRYDPRTGEPKDYYLSSVDNFHLALALYTLAQLRTLTSDAHEAAALLRRMSFEDLLDRPRGLVYGGLRRHGENWIADSWTYRYFGSEARSIYAAGPAIGLYRDTTDWSSRSVGALDREVFDVSTGGKTFHLLGLWDGGAFQLYLPSLLIGEEHYSDSMRSYFSDFALHMVAEGKQRGLPVPAAHSACEFPDDYNGKAGTRNAVSSQNQDIFDPNLSRNWDRVFTPHAAILAAPFALDSFIPALVQAETLNDSHDSLYRPGLGWMDGYVVEGTGRGKVVPIILSLDQAMIALSAAKVLSNDHRTAAARALANDPLVHAKLQRFYGAIQ